MRNVRRKHIICTRRPPSPVNGKQGRNRRAAKTAPQSHTSKEHDAMKTAKPPKEERTVWDDADVAEFFGISKATLQRRARRPVAGEIDPNDAKPGIIGGRRFWLRDNVLALAGIKPTTRGTR